ncbi:MAG: hypothetical protein ACRCTE_13870 [Cellulosilyticaceae bacterium]
MGRKRTNDKNDKKPKIDPSIIVALINGIVAITVAIIQYFINS